MRDILGIAAICALTMTTSGEPAWAAKGKNQDIQTLLAKTGAREMGQQIKNRMVKSLGKTMPQVKAATWAKLMQEIDDKELTSEMVKIYDKHLSHPEVLNLIKFFNTPLGEKVRNAGSKSGDAAPSFSLAESRRLESFFETPVGKKWSEKISEESKEAGRQFGYKIADQLLVKLREKGLDE